MTPQPPIAASAIIEPQRRIHTTPHIHHNTTLDIYGESHAPFHTVDTLSITKHVYITTPQHHFHNTKNTVADQYNYELILNHHTSVLMLPGTPSSLYYYMLD